MVIPFIRYPLLQFSISVSCELIYYISKLKVWLKRNKHLRKARNLPADPSIITAYDNSTNLTPATTTTSTPSNPAPTPSQPRGFAPLQEPISLMHLLTPPRHSSAPDITTPASTPHRPIPHPSFPIPTPYLIYPQTPQNIHMTPPHQIHRTPFQTPPFHTLPHTPQTYPQPLHPKRTPQVTPQPKTQPSTPYTPYPISPPISPKHSRAQASSPVQLQFTGKSPPLSNFSIFSHLPFLTICLCFSSL
jgi:hypothetical protein